MEAVLVVAVDDYHAAAADQQEGGMLEAELLDSLGAREVVSHVAQLREVRANILVECIVARALEPREVASVSRKRGRTLPLDCW